MRIASASDFTPTARTGDRSFVSAKKGPSITIRFSPET